MRCGLLLLGAVGLAAAEPAVVRDLGIPVRGVNWGRLHAGATADGKPSILISFGQNNGGLFVADVDFATGHCTQYAVKDRAASTFPTASFRSLRTGFLYIGSAWDAHLHRFDPAHPERGVEDLGKIDPDDAIFPTGITEAPDGAIFIGTCNGARLVRFDPATSVFTRFGRMDETDNYLYPLAGDDGSLAALVKVVRPHLIVIDPKTGEHHEVGPAITDTTDKTRYLKLFKGTDHLLYLDSHAGKFRVDGMKLTAVDSAPAELPGIHSAYTHHYQAPLVMPGGWTARFLDDNDVGAGAPRKIQLTNTDPGIAPRTLTLDWQGGGANLHVMEPGPGGRIYGSGYMPNHLFTATPDGRELADLGKHSMAMGEAYSLATVGGKIYLASYPEARLSVYDPARPLHFGTEPADNPRDLGRLDAIGYRPNAMLATPDGRIWLGAGPDYGLVGGTLAWFDPRSGEKKSHRAIVPETSPAALLWLPEQQQILIGLSIECGTGAKVQRLAGAFALWEPKADRLVWSGDLGLDNLADVCSLAPAGGGLVYALIGRGDHIISQGAPEITPRLVLLDPAKRAVVASAWLPKEYGPVSWHGLFALRPAASGTVYGATAHCVFRIKPGTCEVERVWQHSTPKSRDSTVWLTAADPEAIDVVGPIIGGELFFATGWRLRAVTLPGEK
ncbi:MAG: hypothetical protein PSU94_11820 [Lacunisphaera sp.]|nr:hypothetical protein [Lacunisphaera sp.]